MYVCMYVCMYICTYNATGMQLFKHFSCGIHWQQVRLIWQQGSDDRHSQSLRQAEWSAEQCYICSSIPAKHSVWNAMYALASTMNSVRW